MVLLKDINIKLSKYKTFILFSLLFSLILTACINSEQIIKAYPEFKPLTAELLISKSKKILISYSGKTKKIKFYDVADPKKIIFKKSIYFPYPLTDIKLEDAKVSIFSKKLIFNILLKDFSVIQKKNIFQISKTFPLAANKLIFISKKYELIELTNNKIVKKIKFHNLNPDILSGTKTRLVLVDTKQAVAYVLNHNLKILSSPIKLGMPGEIHVLNLNFERIAITNKPSNKLMLLNTNLGEIAQTQTIKNPSLISYAMKQKYLWIMGNVEPKILAYSFNAGVPILTKTIPIKIYSSAYVVDDASGIVYLFNSKIDRVKAINI